MKDLTIQEVRKTFLDCSKDVTNQIAMLTMESSVFSSIWFRCPHCDTEVCIIHEEEIKLRVLYNKKKVNGELEIDLLCSCPTCDMRSTANDIFDTSR